VTAITSAAGGTSSSFPRLLCILLAGGTLLGCAERNATAAAASGGRVSGAGGVAARTVSGEATTPATRPAGTAPTIAPVIVEDGVAPAEVIDGGPKGLATGSKGAPVVALEGRLAALRFNPGKADGAYDAQLAMAVMAFQKQQDLPRTGRADPATLAKLAASPLGIPMVATTEPTRVEIDLKRQMAQFWKDGRLTKVLAVSTGNGRPYCAPKDKGGACDVAITPGGSYRADRKIQGLRVSPLGSLYDPVYFFGGIAIHGSPSIPATPASHGCVRVPMWESGWVHGAISIGDPIYVVGGKTAPVPFGATAPVEAPDEVATPPVAA